MEIQTQSGIVKGAKSNHYMKWLQGYTSTNAWTGASTVTEMWKRTHELKNGSFKNISWYDLGVVAGLLWFEDR